MYELSLNNMVKAWTSELKSILYICIYFILYARFAHLRFLYMIQIQKDVKT